MQAYQIKVTLLKTQPLIWRRILVSDFITLRKLHKILQIAMGWTDSHLHHFKVLDRHSSKKQIQIGGGYCNEDKTLLRDIVQVPGDRFLYKYDYGNNWQHELLLEVKLIRNKMVRPCCISGERNCPPEGCGGHVGYAALLEALLAPVPVENHDKLTLHINGDFDPGRFNLNEINKKLRQLKL